MIAKKSYKKLHKRMPTIIDPWSSLNKMICKQSKDTLQRDQKCMETIIRNMIKFQILNSSQMVNKNLIKFKKLRQQIFSKELEKSSLKVYYFLTKMMMKISNFWQTNPNFIYPLKKKTIKGIRNA